MGRPLRVLVIIDDLRVAGAQRVLAEEARTFDRNRVALDVVVLSKVSGEDLAGEISARGVPVTYATGRGLLDARRPLGLARLIRARRADVVHTHLTYANTLGVIAARLANRPAVVSLHSVTTELGRFGGLKRLIESFVLRHWATRVLVVASTAVEETRRNFGVPEDRLVVLPNAVNLDRVRLPSDFDRAAKKRSLGVPPEAALICAVGRLWAVKGHRVLLEAAPSVRHPNAYYALVGDGPALDELRAQVGALGIRDRVLFLGNRDDVAELVAASNVFAMPSFREGLSLALLEAMAIGTPVVATAVGGTGDVLTDGQTGWLVPPGDPVALARAIGEALADPARASAYAERARRLVHDQFSADVRARRLEQLYLDVIGSPSQ